MDNYMKKAHNASKYFKQVNGFISSHGHSTPQSDTPAAPATHQGGPLPAGEAAVTPAAAEAAKGNSHYGELLSNAKVLYQGIHDKATGSKTSGISEHQMAMAASNVLKAAESAGLSKDSPYGQYIGKAQGYLHSYGNKGAASVASQTGSRP